MQPLSLDQVSILLAVVEGGSFSAAARRLNRAQSVVTYAIQKLEEQVGLPLFDRTAYRPILTEAGRALLPRMQRIVADSDALLSHAEGMAQGLEPELSLVVDAMFPLPRLLDALRAFGAAFPQVSTRLDVEALGATGARVLDGSSVLGLVPLAPIALDPLVLHPLLEVELVPVAAPCHPLAAVAPPIAEEQLRAHVQLVLRDRSPATAGQDFGVFSSRTWRLGDLGMKHAMLLAGLGWGSMPRHMVDADLAEGRLVALRRSGGTAQVRMCVAHRRDAVVGPAARWMVAYLLAA